MRPPVGVAHPDPVAAAAAVELRGGHTAVLEGPPTLEIAKTVTRPATLVLPQPRARPRDLRPIAASVGLLLVAALALWRFTGDRLQTTGATSRGAERPPASPIQPLKPAAPPPSAATVPAASVPRATAPAVAGRSAATGPTVRAAPKILEDHNRVEMRLAQANDLERRRRGGKTPERPGREIVQVVRHDVPVFRAQQSRRQRFHVRHEDETMSARFQLRRCLAKKFSRLGQMLDDGPKRDGIKTPAAEIAIQERFTHDFDAAALSVVERRAGDIGSCDCVKFREPRFELKQKCAGRTTDIQYCALAAPGSKPPQFALETHRRIIALKFVTRQIEGHA